MLDKCVLWCLITCARCIHLPGEMDNVAELTVAYAVRIPPIRWSAKAAKKLFDVFHELDPEMFAVAGDKPEGLPHELQTVLYGHAGQIAHVPSLKVSTDTIAFIVASRLPGFDWIGSGEEDRWRHRLNDNVPRWLMSAGEALGVSRFARVGKIFQLTLIGEASPGHRLRDRLLGVKLEGPSTQFTVVWNEQYGDYQTRIEVNAQTGHDGNLQVARLKTDSNNVDMSKSVTRGTMGSIFEHADLVATKRIREILWEGGE